MSVTIATIPIFDAAAQAELQAALHQLHSGRGLVVRAADAMGRFMAQAGRFTLLRLGMSAGVQDRFAGVAQAALSRAYDIAILGLNRDEPAMAARAGGPLVVASGAVSGFAGLAGFLPDAALTTLVIMRDVARIARDSGEDLATEDARRACLEVFALRGDDDELGYFSARLMLHGRPVTQIMAQIAGRYGAVLGEKFSAQAVPVAGAVAGAALNAAFLDHYRKLARAHFTIRRLERVYGRETVRAVADAAANPGGDAPFMAA
jgi:hypothetical protein